MNVLCYTHLLYLAQRVFAGSGGPSLSPSSVRCDVPLSLSPPPSPSLSSSHHPPPNATPASTNPINPALHPILVAPLAFALPPVDELPGALDELVVVA